MYTWTSRLSMVWSTSFLAASGMELSLPPSTREPPRVLRSAEPEPAAATSGKAGQLKAMDNSRIKNRISISLIECTINKEKAFVNQSFCLEGVR
jgi:hypothetical protein